MNGNISGQIIEVSLTQFELISFIAAIASLILAIVAIILSITFYKMSDKAAKESERSARKIEASVVKVETLFDKLYSDTFGIVKDTFSDMSKHVYANTNNQISEEKLKEQIEEKTNPLISEGIKEIKSSTKNEDELSEVIRNIIAQSKEIEKDIKIEKLRREILEILTNRVNGRIRMDDLLKMLNSLGYNYYDIRRELTRLKNNNLITIAEYLDNNNPNLSTYARKHVSLNKLEKFDLKN